MNLTTKMDRIEERSVTLEQLRTFVFIAEHGSFVSAGEKLGRTQSTLSASLRRLEMVVGCRLIERRQGLFLGLTEDGQQLLPAAYDILKRTNVAIGALKKVHLKGHVVLGVPDDFHMANLHKIISLCLEENPGLRVEIISASSTVLSAMAAQQQLDVVILKSLAGQPLTSKLERVLNVEPLHWMSSNAIQHFSEMKEVPLVTFPDGCVLRKCAMTTLEDIKQPYYLSYVSGSFDNIRRAVVSGLGISLLPRSSLSDDLHILTQEGGAPPVPAIQLVINVTRSGKLYKFFSRYINQNIIF